MDDNIEDTDTEKDSDGKTATKTPGVDEYEFKDEEEEEDLSKALNDRHIPRRELRQREKEDKDGNHAVGKQNKGDSSSKSKKQKTPHVHCSSDTSSDETESASEKRSSPTCSQSSESHKPDGRLKKDVDQKDKGKVKRKSKSQIKNKENQEDGKENSKTLVLSLATVSENTEKCREEDSFKMSFSPKDDSSVHLFHLSSIKAPKLNHGLADKQSPLKQENTKISISDSYNHYSDGDYCTESSSTKGCKHREKSKHQQKDSGLDADDGHSSPYKDSSIGNSLDGSDSALRKTDLDGKVVKKHKIKHKEKDKHRRECEAERSRHRQKEARKDGHRNLEFDREFWKENFFKSDEADELLGAKKEGEDVSSLQRASDSSPVKDERNSKERHPGSKEKKPREEREKEKAVKKEKVKDLKPSERDEKVDCHGSGWIPEEPLQNNGLKEEMEEKPISRISADQDQLESSEKASRDKSDKRLPGKEKDSDKMEKRHLEKEKKIKLEHTDKAEPQNSVDRWKEKERTVPSFSLGDKSFRENERLKPLSAVKKHEDGRKNKDKFDKRSDRERQDREYGAGDHKDRDRANADRRGKPLEKSSDHSKSDRFKEKDCDRKKRDKIKDGSLSSSSNLKLLLEDKKSYLSESTKILSLKSKEEVARTPEKDRDRRDRDRDSDRHRDKDKDKDRHKDRSQQAKINKHDAEKTKSKSSAASRDGKPKEKRLVNDDLMQTSFERMLSMKDQEIELWHRKHLEKIKQKERERLKQRPLADLGKSKPKDRTKPEPYLSKELIRSKSSEAPEVHGRERSLKDGMSPRTVSLDGKSLPAIGTKVMSAVENCLSRSPRPESERGGLMSRSVSMHSVVSSEDSCQASTLTPRNAEYDSDVNLEASDSQQAFLQSSLIIQAARSPSVHDKDCNSLPDVLQTNRTPLPGRHESPYLRAILNEDANSSAEGKGVDHLSKSSPTGTAGEELRPKETEPEESPSSHLNSSSAPDPGSERDGGAVGGLDSQLLIRDLPSKNLKTPHSSASESGSTEQKPPPVFDPVAEKDASSLTVVSQGGESDLPLTSAASPEPSAPTNTKTFQQRDLPPAAGTENQQQVQSGSPQGSDQPVDPPDGPEEEDMETSSERLGSPVLPSCLHILSSAEGEPSPGSNKTESKGSEEDQILNDPDCKKSWPSGDDTDSCVEFQTEGGASRLSPDHKAEDATDVPQSVEPNRIESSSLEGSLSSEGPSESKLEVHPEPMEVSPPEEIPESSSEAEEQSPTSVQQLAQDSSSASGGSSPQSGDQESDSSGAKLKLRPTDEEVDFHVPHPRKRKMPRLSSSQLCSTAQQEKEKCQQSLAAIVDSVKLEEIEPYQTERANPYYEFLHIRKKIEEKRKVLCNVTPQPPQYYDEYVTFNGSYLLDGNPLSKLCIPTVSVLSGLTKPLHSGPLGLEIHLTLKRNYS